MSFILFDHGLLGLPQVEFRRRAEPMEGKKLPQDLAQNVAMVDLVKQVAIGNIIASVKHP